VHVSKPPGQAQRRDQADAWPGAALQLRLAYQQTAQCLWSGSSHSPLPRSPLQPARMPSFGSCVSSPHLPPIRHQILGPVIEERAPARVAMPCHQVQQQGDDGAPPLVRSLMQLLHHIQRDIGAQGRFPNNILSRSGDAQVGRNRTHSPSDGRAWQNRSARTGRVVWRYIRLGPMRVHANAAWAVCSVPTFHAPRLDWIVPMYCSPYRARNCVTAFSSSNGGWMRRCRAALREVSQRRAKSSLIPATTVSGIVPIGRPTKRAKATWASWSGSSVGEVRLPRA